MVSEFSFEPAPAPYLVDADPRVVARGERVTLRYALAAGGPGRTVGIVAGPDPGAKPEQTLPIFDASDHIAPMFGTVAMVPGRYSAVLLDRGDAVLASSPFWVVEPEAQPRIETDRAVYRRGEPVDVSWSGGPGNKLDYVAIFRASSPSLYSYLGYRYVDARPAGTVRFGVGSPLAPGRYVARLMLDDGYSVIAETPFEVR